MTEIDRTRIPAAFRPFAEALLARTGAAAGLARLLGTLGPRVAKRDAEAMALLLRDALPTGDLVSSVTDRFLRERYPAWYIEALNDPHRNRAYAEALAAVVTPRSVVVEVGTGSGLFAMMAARAGARHVYTFESEPAIAGIARTNIARNGLGDRITVIGKAAEEAAIGDDLPAPGDVLMHEFSHPGFVVDGLDRVLDRHLGRLVVAGAPVLPARFEARAVLCGDAALADAVRVPGPVEGLDVGAINALALASLALPRGAPVDVPLTEPFTFGAVDLGAGERLDDGTDRLVVRATASGRAVGHVRWIAQHFPGGAVYENAPGRRCNWRPEFRPFAEPLAVRAGEPVELAVTRFGHQLFLDPA